jgi:hypothetical protein
MTILKFCLLYLYYKCNYNVAIAHIMLACLLAFTTCVFILSLASSPLAFLSSCISLELNIIGKMYINFIWNLYTNESFKFILFGNACMRDNLLERICTNYKTKGPRLARTAWPVGYVFRTCYENLIFFPH